MNRRVWSRTAATLLLAVWATQSLAVVEREDIIILRADGLHFTSYKTLRSDLAERVLYLGPDEAPNDAVFIVPSDYESTPLDDGGTRLHFKSGSFALMNTGAFDAEVERQPNDIFVFSSWDGVTRSDGHLGKWNAPNDFSSFSYTWVLPRNIDILAYEANRQGTWEQRENTLNWTGKQINDLAFKIRYRVNDPDAAAEPAKAKRAPAPATAQRQPAPPPQTQPRVLSSDLETAPSSSIENEPPPPAQASRSQPEQAEPSEPAPSSAPSESRRVTLEQAVSLENGRPRLTEHGRKILRRLAGALSSGELERVVVHGPDFADSRDTGGSVAQAARVSDFLAAYGVAENRIAIRAGKRTDNATGERIEISVAPGGLLDDFSKNR